ncbi:hypothetical protein LPJ55_001930 [Coemansia sp. RSA 990]|nr:hypothetical protein LPJ55_001930 [Coemansia sp. RSA 990]
MDLDMDTKSACARVPTEILLEIFTLLTPFQQTLHACVMTCRRWNWIATPLLWRQPRFDSIASVEKLAASLLTTHQPVSQSDGKAPVQVNFHAQLIKTLSFTTLPEADRNNPHLATLLDTIVNCMAVAVPTHNSMASVPGPSNWDASASAQVLKRSRSLSRNDDGTVRPHSAAGIPPLPDSNTNGECCGNTSSATGIEAELSDKPNGSATAGQETLPHTVDDTGLHYASLPHPTPIAASCPATLPLPQQTEHFTHAAAQFTSLRQLDLRFCKGVRNYSLQRLAPKLATLTVLNLAGGLRTDITIAKLAQHMFQLRCISLAWTSNLTDFGICELVQRCKSIECLDLTYCTQIEDTAMFAIAHNLRNLSALGVAYCAGITDIGVREVVASCPLISILDVTKCLRVSSRTRKALEQHRIVAQCGAFDPFSIFKSASNKQRTLKHTQ